MQVSQVQFTVVPGETVRAAGLNELFSTVTSFGPVGGGLPVPVPLGDVDVVLPQASDAARRKQKNAVRGSRFILLSPGYNQSNVSLPLPLPKR